VSPPTPRLLAATREGSGIRLVGAARLVCSSCVATCRPDRVRLVRHTWGVGGGPTRPTRPTLSGSVGRRCHGRRDSSDSPSVESAPDSSTRRLLGLCRTKMSPGGATRQTRRRSKVPPTRRLVDSSDSVGRRCHGRRDSSDSPSVGSAPDSSTRQPPPSSIFFWSFGSPGDRIRAANPLGKFDESDAAPFKCVSGRRLSVL
jgi:hypothetical protein